MHENKNASYLRNMVIGVEKKVPLLNNSIVTGINFDNAATTPPLKSVLEAINEFSPWYSSIHRGNGYKSTFTTEFYDKSRITVGNFVHSDLNHDTIIYVKNATEAINLLAGTLHAIDSRQIVLTTEMEHHSNLLPWTGKFVTDFVKVDKNGRLSLHHLEKMLQKYKDKVKLVAVTGASNVTGYTNPIHEIASICHRYGARIVVDAAQMVPHCRVDMRSPFDPGHIDFLIFSAHKLYAPFGTGVLIGPRTDFEKVAPDYSGGGTVKYVTKNKVTWSDPPEKNEAGTPNVMGVVALDAAIHGLSRIGMENISQYETLLFEYAISKLSSIPDIIIYNDIAPVSGLRHHTSSGNCDKKHKESSTGIHEACCRTDQIGIIPFNVKDLHHDIVAKALSRENGIAVRSGCFCAHPYVQKLLGIKKNQRSYYMRHPQSEKPGMVRVSFGLYNTFDEIDILADSLLHIVENKDQYASKYK